MLDTRPNNLMNAWGMMIINGWGLNYFDFNGLVLQNLLVSIYASNLVPVKLSCAARIVGKFEVYYPD